MHTKKTGQNGPFLVLLCYVHTSAFLFVYRPPIGRGGCKNDIGNIFFKKQSKNSSAGAKNLAQNGLKLLSKHIFPSLS